MPDGLTPEQVARVSRLVIARLRIASIRSPAVGETEPLYTSSAIQPVVADELQRIAVPGLVNAGDGAAPVATVAFLGLHFYPDVAVSHLMNRLLAIEVKFVGTSGRQGSIATALGQASLYRQAGYKEAAVFLIDGAHLPTTDLDAATHRLRETQRVHLILRRRGPGQLLPHSAQF